MTHASPQPGERVLDVATGTAPAAIAATRAVGPGGSVTGVDVSPGMLAHARRNIAASGVGNVALIEADGARLPFGTSSFDVATCSSSIVWFPDIPDALREWQRVIQPGGRLVFSTMAASALPLGALYRAHLRGYGVDFPDLNEPLNTPEKCRRAMRKAGFGRATICVFHGPAWLETVDKAVTAGAFPLAADPDDERDWEGRRRQPVALWASLRRRVPIPVPLSASRPEQLADDYRNELDGLKTSDGIVNPTTALLVMANR